MKGILRKIYKASRLRSLPLSVAGILMGSALALNVNTFRGEVFCLAILSAIVLQLLSDYANDYGDFVKGVDNSSRKGPQRAIQGGVMTPQEMKKLVVGSGILAFIAISLLIWIAFGGENFLYSLLFLGVGLLAIYAAIKYTMGKSPYGYHGLGDVFVFVFFGIVSVMGSYFLHTLSSSWKLLLPATAMGLLSVGVLNLNNLRDIENDKIMGKRTIPVRIGEEYARMYHYFLIILPMILLMGYSIWTLQVGVKALYIIAFIPLALHLIFIKKHRTPQAYDSQLKVVALSTFFIALLMFIGQWL